jgi:predicted HD phosphohydrolase
MDPRDFLKLAEQLVVAHQAGAAQFRTAIGRAYYSAFNVASQVLDQLGFSPAENAHGSDRRSFQPFVGRLKRNPRTARHPVL